MELCREIGSSFYAVKPPTNGITLSDDLDKEIQLLKVEKQELERRMHKTFKICKRETDRLKRENTQQRNIIAKYKALAAEFRHEFETIDIN